MTHEYKGSERQWYAVHVRSRHEFSVLELLEKAGREAFLPTVERFRKWKDRKKMVSFSLFPGYLFVRITKSTDDRLSLLKTKGIVRLLGALPGEPEPVPEEQIAALKRLVDSKQPLDPYPYLKEGQRVRVSSGALAGVEGLLVEKSGQHMLVLSVDILRQGVSLKVDASEVEPV
jgi:transcription termination/antitermination protein NusG